MKRLLLLFLLLPVALQAQNPTQCATLPATCTVGQICQLLSPPYGYHYCGLTDTWLPYGGGTNVGGGPVVARKTADQSTTSSAFQDVSDLAFGVNASTAYYLECNLTYTTVGTTTAAQFSLNGPASPTALTYFLTVSTGATGTHHSVQTAWNSVLNPATGGGTTILPARIVANFENGVNAGTLQVRFRSETNGNSVLVRRGSVCVLY